ncbi:AAEL005205-PA [Aedes aegypti]|uniref:AAEL005205-PA n=2 Tax=Aedes aegypti TaxID=7159 RepID=A0A6E8PLB5_AEDAE|nr:type-1 angiotensin II receptor-associated protein [Aedes aegypti]EAT43391.1 AAEL005205-PA [Aedes aegypti]
MDLQSALNTPHIRVKLVAMIHTTLIAAALNSYWLPASYQFYNILFIISLFWAIHWKESSDAVQIACLIDVIGFLFDLTGIILYFPSKGAILSAVFAIFNLALRPFTLLLLHRELTDRGGRLSLTTEATGNNPSSYEDIDQHHQVFTPTVLS